MESCYQHTMQNTAVILAMDTSLGPCSVAITRGGEIVAEVEESSPGKQSRKLVPMIESALNEAGLNYKDLDAVACTIGPGGFTGIRVGLATARAIALATDKPLIGLTTLEVIAWEAQYTGDMLAVIDAYRGQRYAQRFRLNVKLIPQSDPLLVDEKSVSALGHGAKIVQHPPHARFAATLAAAKWSDGERDFPTAPLYLREPDAKLPASEGLKCGGELL
jgi:tRNA threonylcarbamoyladenosine biosynthesis protein TsaB